MKVVTYRDQIAKQLDEIADNNPARFCFKSRKDYRYSAKLYASELFRALKLYFNLHDWPQICTVQMSSRGDFKQELHFKLSLQIEVNCHTHATIKREMNFPIDTHWQKMADAVGEAALQIVAGKEEFLKGFERGFKLGE